MEPIYTLFQYCGLGTFNEAWGPNFKTEEDYRKWTKHDSNRLV